MNNGLSQYFQRSPRYILMPQDECLIRVAGPKQTPWEEGTEIRNISNTGLCFTAPEILLPRIGEYVRVQFDVPGSQPMACHGRVVRIEKINAETSLVGLEFESLSSAQRWNLTRGLRLKKRDENDNLIEIKPAPKINNWLSFLFYFSTGFSLFFASFLLIALYKFLSNPFWFEESLGFAKTILRFLAVGP